MDFRTAAVRVHCNLSVHVFIYIVLLSAIHYIKKSKVLFCCLSVAQRYVTLEMLYDMRNKQFYCKKMIHLRNANFNAKFATAYFCRRNIPDILTPNGFLGSVSWTVSFKTIHVRMLLPHGSVRGGTPSVIFDKSSLRSKVKRLSSAFASKYVTQICGAHASSRVLQCCHGTTGTPE